MTEELNELTYWTLFLGVVCIGLSRVFMNRWFTPATWYWLAWVGCLSSYGYVIGLDMLPEPEELTISVLTDAHMGAFFGFIAMGVISRFLPDSRQPNSAVSDRFSFLDSVSVKKIDQLLMLYFLVAVALLSYRIATVGKVDLAFLQSARESFIGQDKSAIRPFLLMLPISLPLTLTISARFASGTLKVRRLVILFAICFLTAMADASRMRFLQVLALGVIVTVMVIDGGAGRRFKTLISGYWLGALTSIVALIGVLQTIQIVRSTGSIETVLTDPMLVFLPINLMTYLAQGTSAMALFYEAANGPITGGDLTFAFPMKYGAMLGLNEAPLSAGDVFGYILAILDDPRVQRGGISGIGMLLTDFGPEKVWIASFCMAAVLQILFVACINRGFIGHAVAACCCMASLFSVLNLWFLSAPMVVGLFWCVVIGRWLNIPLWTGDGRSTTQV